jgi:hypothetical protein
MKLAPVAPANNKQVNFIENSHVGKVAIRGVGGFLDRGESHIVTVSRSCRSGVVTGTVLFPVVILVQCFPV